MTLNAKALGLALAAMLALSGLVAQGASASPLTVETKTTFLTGEQEGLVTFETAAGKVQCPEATFSAQASGESIGEFTVTPNWPTEKKGGGGNCTAFGFATVHLLANGCTFTFTTPTSLGSNTVTWGTEALHQLCPIGKKLEVTVTTLGASQCTLYLEPQTPTAGHITGTNAAGSNPTEPTLSATLEKLHYTASGGGSCGSTGTNTDGKFTGNVKVKCYSNAAHTVQISCKAS